MASGVVGILLGMRDCKAQIEKKEVKTNNYGREIQKRDPER